MAKKRQKTKPPSPFPSSLGVRLEALPNDHPFLVCGPVDTIVNDGEDGEAIAIYTLQEVRTVKVTIELV
jgi:hypothetical protein